MNVVKVLFALGAKANAKGSFGELSLLHIAVGDRDASKELVGLLILEGADVNDRDEKNRTPLHIASQRADPEIVKLLLENNAEVNLRDVKGRTPLFLAVRRGRNLDNQMQVVRSLVENGADPNIPNKETGENSLHEAVSVGRSDKLVAYLIDEASADINRMDKDGNTPLYIAKYKNKPKSSEIVSVLEKRSAKIGVAGYIKVAMAVLPSLLSLCIAMRGYFLLLTILSLFFSFKYLYQAREHYLIKEYLIRWKKQTKTGRRHTFKAFRWLAIYTFSLLFAYALIPPILYGAPASVKVAGALIFVVVFTLILPKVLRKIFLEMENAASCRTPSAEQVLKQDLRPPALYLRSFIDDRRRPERMRLLNAIMGPEATFETDIVRLLLQVGPVVAVDKPGEELPPLGAARYYFSDSEWQTNVLALMENSSIILLRFNITEGVKWELEQIALRSYLYKLVLVFPIGGERDERMQLIHLAIEQIRSLHPVHLPENLLDPCAVYFRNPEHPRFFESSDKIFSSSEQQAIKSIVKSIVEDRKKT